VVETTASASEADDDAASVATSEASGVAPAAIESEVDQPQAALSVLSTYFLPNSSAGADGLSSAGAEGLGAATSPEAQPPATGSAAEPVSGMSAEAQRAAEPAIGTSAEAQRAAEPASGTSAEAQRAAEPASGTSAEAQREDAEAQPVVSASSEPVTLAEACGAKESASEPAGPAPVPISTTDTADTVAPVPISTTDTADTVTPATTLVPTESTATEATAGTRVPTPRADCRSRY
jgi:hypothetical protein